MSGPIDEDPAPAESQAGREHDRDDVRLQQRREQNRRYRESHAEQIAANRRRWLAANREHVRETKRVWRVEHLDRSRQLNRESARRVADRAEREAAHRARARVRAKSWREDHPDEVRAYQARWVEQNREKVRGYYNDYYRNHSEEVSARAAARRDADPEPMKQARKAWAARNKERLAELQRERRSDPDVYDAQLEANAAARRLKRRLVNTGLPPKQLHPVSAAERRAHARETTAYFSDPDLFERVRQRTVFTESLTKHLLENGAEMRAFAESYVATRARLGLPPVAVDNVTYARAVEYVVDHLRDTDLLTSRDVAAAVRSSKATVLRAEREQQFDRLVKTVVAHVGRHRCRLEEEAEIENRARTQRGLSRVTADALLVRLAVQETFETVPTNRLRGDDLRSAVQKAQFYIAMETNSNADNSNAIALRSLPGRQAGVRIR
jgi:hypothetical protein